MKKVLLIAAFAVFGLTTSQAQENAIKANPLALLGGSDLLAYERAIGDNTSVLIGAGIGGFKIGNAKYASFGGEAQFRYYFSEAINGWYGGARANFVSGKVTIEDSWSWDGEDPDDFETSYTAIGAGILGGYQWIFNSGFLIDINLGAAYKTFSYDDSEGVFSGLKASGVLPTFGFGIGYAF